MLIQIQKFRLRKFRDFGGCVEDYGAQERMSVNAESQCCEERRFAMFQGKDGVVGVRGRGVDGSDD